MYLGVPNILSTELWDKISIIANQHLFCSTFAFIFLRHPDTVSNHQFYLFFIVIDVVLVVRTQSFFRHVCEGVF